MRNGIGVFTGPHTYEHVLTHEIRYYLHLGMNTATHEDTQYNIYTHKCTRTHKTKCGTKPNVGHYTCKCPFTLSHMLRQNTHLPEDTAVYRNVSI